MCFEIVSCIPLWAQHTQQDHCPATSSDILKRRVHLGTLHIAEVVVAFAPPDIHARPHRFKSMFF